MDIAPRLHFDDKKQKAISVVRNLRRVAGNVLSASASDRILRLQLRKPSSNTSSDFSIGWSDRGLVIFTVRETRWRPFLDLHVFLRPQDYATAISASPLGTVVRKTAWSSRRLARRCRQTAGNSLRCLRGAFSSSKLGAHSRAASLASRTKHAVESSLCCLRQHCTAALSFFAQQVCLSIGPSPSRVSSGFMEARFPLPGSSSPKRHNHHPLHWWFVSFPLYLPLRPLGLSLGSLSNALLEKQQASATVSATMKSRQRAGEELFDLPVQEGWLTSYFGWRDGRSYFHNGIDIAVEEGTDIFAVVGGRVTDAGWRGGYGRTVTIDHGNGFTTLYAHCNRLHVRKGQQVSRGQRIALSGSTGNSTGPHLHFEVHKEGQSMDPLEYLPPIDETKMLEQWTP